MKIFIFSTLILGFVAMNAKGVTSYAPNDGMNSPGTFNSKSTTATRSSDKAGMQIPIGEDQVSPQKMNSSPNPAPTNDEIGDSSYGETIVKPFKQSQEAKPNKKTLPKQ